MSDKTFGRARRGSGKTTPALRPLTSRDKADLRLLRGGRCKLPKNALPPDHPVLEGIEKRSRSGQERWVEKRCLSALAMSTRPSDQVMALTISRCMPTTPCHNAVCWLCKHRYAEARKEQAWALFRRIPREDIYLVTVLCKLIYGGVRKVKRAVRKLKARVRHVFRSMAKGDPRFSGVAWLGSFEIDHYANDIEGESTKALTLRAMEGFKVDTTDALQLLHAHFVVAGNGLSKEELSTVFSRLFPGTKCVEVKQCYRTGTKRENVERMAAYTSKCHPYYKDVTNDSEGDRQAEEGVIFEGRPRVNARRARERVFEADDLLYHARLHAALGGLGGALKFDRGCNSRFGYAQPKQNAAPQQRRSPCRK